MCSTLTLFMKKFSWNAVNTSFRPWQSDSTLVLILSRSFSRCFLCSNVCVPFIFTNVEIITPKVMVLGVGSLMKGLNLWEPSWLRLVPLQKRPQGETPAFYNVEVTARSLLLWTGKLRPAQTKLFICLSLDVPII